MSRIIAGNSSMAKTITILLLSLTLHSYGQTARVDTLKVSPSPKFKDIPIDKMNFPVIRTGRKTIDSLINTDIKNRFTDNEYPNLPVKEALNKWAEDGVVYLDFEVTFNKNGMISLNISAEGCGAYCTDWTEYYNYSTITGTPVGISTIIDTTGGFRDLVLKDNHNQFDQYKRDLKKQYVSKDEDLDSDTYKMALESCEECESTFNFRTFKLSSDSIEIINNCWVPHFMLPLTPLIELKYSYKDVHKYLKTKNWP